MTGRDKSRDEEMLDENDAKQVIMLFQQYI